jgi:hypothetical protein
MLSFPHCLDNRLTNGGEVVSLTHRPLSTPHEPDPFHIYLIQEKINRRLNSDNSCYQSVQNLLSKNLTIGTYEAIILHVIMYGCKTWFLTLSKERRLRVFENIFLR